MITLEEALEIHIILIQRFGGSQSLRDQSFFESALERPYQTIDGNELYPTAIDKAALLESQTGTEISICDQRFQRPARIRANKGLAAKECTKQTGIIAQPHETKHYREIPVTGPTSHQREIHDLGHAHSLRHHWLAATGNVTGKQNHHRQQ